MFSGHQVFAVPIIHFEIIYSCLMYTSEVFLFSVAVGFANFLSYWRLDINTKLSEKF